MLVLLATIGVALALVALIGGMRSEGAGSIAADMLVTVTFIEVGFLARLAVYVVADAVAAAVRTAIFRGGADRLTVVPETAGAGMDYSLKFAVTETAKRPPPTSAVLVPLHSDYDSLALGSRRAAGSG